MKIDWQAFTAPKLGNSPAENEDAFQPRLRRRRYGLTEPFSCAIADGATESSFSGLWASLVVRRLRRSVAEPSLGRPSQSFAEIQADRRKEGKSKTLPWFAEEKVRKGAFTSLTWLNIRQSNPPMDSGGEWKALAMGDSNLFQVRGDQIIVTFPVESSVDFGNSPFLLPSNPALLPKMWPYAHERGGDWIVGDFFLLMTDAIAGWFLHALEDGIPLNALLKELSFNNFQQFNDWLGTVRHQHAIKNDDTTLTWIRIVDN